jgi:two-component system NarL family response regulator
VIRVAIVDDHPIVREGLVAALDGRHDIAVAGVHESGDEAIVAISHDRPNVVVLDLEGTRGLEAIAALAKSAAVLVLTAYNSDEQLERALGAGALGYLLKGSSVDEIERAIQTVAAGQSYLDPRLASRVLAISSGPRLTTREREVLRLVAAGKSNKEIASALGVTERTVKFHVTSILTKLVADNRAQAAVIAAQRGLL